MDKVSWNWTEKIVRKIVAFVSLRGLGVIQKLKMNSLFKIIEVFQRDKREGGNYFQTFGRKFVHTFYLHRYEIFVMKKFFKGRILNLGPGKHCGEYGIDFDLRYERDDYTDIHGAVPTPDIVGDVNHLPFKEGKFDTVIMMHLLEYVPRPCEVLRNVLNLLKSGGVLCGTLPNGEPRLHYNYFRDKRHLHAWSRWGFFVWLAAHRFRVVQFNKMKKIFNQWSFDFVIK